MTERAPRAVSAVTDETRLLWRVVTYGLPGQPAQLLDGLGRDRRADEPLDAATWSALLSGVTRHRVPGFLMAAIEDGALQVTDDQLDEARDAHLHACSSVLGLERRLLDIVELFEDADIEVVALKGSAHAHLLYPDPALRHFGDVDVLVPSGRIMDAVTVLEKQRGAVRQVPEVRAGFDRRYAKSVTLNELDATEIDVHRNLLFGTFGFRIDIDELFHSTVTFEVGGRDLRALGPETRLLHACYHAGLGDKRPRGNSMRDLAQMLVVGDHDPKRTLHLAREWDSLAVVARAVRICRDVAGVEVTGPIAEAVATYRPSRRELRAIASYVGPRNTHGPKVRASLPYCTSRAEAAGLLWATVAPSTSFVRQRVSGRGEWLRRGLRRLRGR